MVKILAPRSWHQQARARRAGQDSRLWEIYSAVCQCRVVSNLKRKHARITFHSRARPATCMISNLLLTVVGCAGMDIDIVGCTGMDISTSAARYYGC
jgi:hypothetical protein